MRRCACVWLVVMIAPSPSKCSDRAVFDTWVGEKVPAAQKRLKRAGSSSFSLNAILDMEMASGGPPVSFKLHALQKSSGGNTFLGTYASDVRPPGEKLGVAQTCAGVNSRYYFELGRNRRGDAWLFERVLGLESASDPSARTQLEAIKREDRPYFDTLSACKFMAGAVQPADLANLPGFVLRSAAPAPDGDTIDVAFSYTQAVPGSPGVVVNCTVRYDLSAYGLPTETTEVSGEAANLRTVKERQKLVSFDGKTCVVETERSQTGLQNNKLVFSMKSRSNATVELGPLPESEFTLTAFGFPEPPGFEPKATPLYVWLLATAVGCLALFTLFRFLARRQAA